MIKMKVVLAYFVYFLCVQLAFTSTNQQRSRTCDSGGDCTIEIANKAEKIKNYVINDIQPVIATLFDDLKVEMDKMAEETIALKQTTTTEIARKEELEKKLQKITKSEKFVKDVGNAATIGEYAADFVNKGSEWVGKRISQSATKNKIISNVGKISDFVAKKSEQASGVLSKVASLYSVYSYVSSFTKNDDAAIELNEITKALQRDRETLKVLTAFKDQVSNKLTPLVSEMQIDLKNLSKNLTFKALVSLDIQKTKLAQMLRGIQKQFASLLHSFGSEYQVADALQRIDDSMDLFINGHDRIQSYVEQIKFAISMNELQ